jgi:6-phosphogluconate dehydrogenase
MKLGFIGLGKMGSRMVTKLFLEKHEIVVWNRSIGSCRDLMIECGKLDNVLNRLYIAETLADLVSRLPRPRIIWMMLPSGAPTESVLGTLADLVESEDILIDGGNSHYKDTEKRSKLLKERKIKLLGIGVSGGIIAEKQGYPLMAGGDQWAYEYIEPILNSLAKPHGGHDYFGTGGAGHFVKMIHNGIEYGIMQSLGEGFEVLQKAPYRFDLSKIARLYQRGTLVSGFMLDRAEEVLRKNPSLSEIKGIIAESGEAQWMIEQAQEEGTEAGIINQALEYRKKSQTEESIQASFTAKFIAALRNAFGGHEILRNGP